MPKRLLQTAVLCFFTAAFLTACGGGEDADMVDTSLEASGYELPSRGPEWLVLPSVESLAQPG